MSFESTMCDSMNKPIMSAKKSSVDARAGRQGVPYCVGPITMDIYACGIF